MSKILANQIANYGDDAPIEIKEGLNIPAGKPIQAAGSSGSSGQVLSTTGTSIAWVAVFDGDYNSLSNKPSIPAAQVPSDWDAAGGVSRILNKPIIPAQPSVTTATAGTPSLSYNTVNGEFTYTPPDLSNYDTAYGWGDHAQAGYITSAQAPDAFTGLTDTPSSITAKAFPRGNFAGDALEFSSTVFENTNGLGIGEDNPISCLHLKRPSDAVYITFDSNSGERFTAGSFGVNPGFFIENGSTGNMLLRTDASDFVALYGGNNKRFETTSNGVQISGDQITTGKLLYSNNYANAVDLPDASTYHGMFAHVHATGKGVFAHGGSWLSLVDETSSINELADVNTASNSDGYVLKWDSGTSTWKPQPDLVGSGGSGIILSDLSVSTASASGGGSLSYGNTTGVFTYTPPDLSGYLTSETDPVYSASPASGILSSNISNWDTAYGWGNHASAGYLTAVSLNLNGLTDVSYTQGNLVSGDSIIWSGTEWTRTTQQFITEEASTLDDVTGRGATTNNSIALTGGLTLNVLSFSTTSGTQINSSGLIIASSTGFAVNNTSNTATVAEFSFASGCILKDNGNNTRLSTLSTGVTIEGTLIAGGLTYPTTNGTSGDVLTSDGAGNVTWQTPAGLQSRTTPSVTQSIANGASANVSITTPKGYALYKIQTSHAAWVTLYSDTTSRTADASRSEFTDPTPGSGVLAEVITGGSATQLITPATVCFNSSGSNTTYAKVVNKSGSTVNLTVTLTLVGLEV